MNKEAIDALIEKNPKLSSAREKLEAMAPLQDRAVLKRMTEHELVSIAFLEAEIAGGSDSTAPLHHYLSQPAGETTAS